MKALRYASAGALLEEVRGQPDPAGVDQPAERRSARDQQSVLGVSRLLRGPVPFLSLHAAARWSRKKFRPPDRPTPRSMR